MLFFLFFSLRVLLLVMYTEGAEERREWARAKADHKEKRRAPEAVHQLLSVYGIDICVYTTRTAILVLFAMLIFWPHNFFPPFYFDFVHLSSAR